MNKQTSISDELRGEIRAGKHEIGKRIPPESELAERFGASTITVNKAVNTLVQEGYLCRPGGSRRGTVVRASRPYPQGLMAFVSIVPGDAFAAAIMDGAMRAAGRCNYLVVPVNPAPEERDSYLRKLEEARFCGILTTSHSGLLETSLPTVYIDKTNLDMHSDIYQVRCDSHQGGCLIAKALLAAGHRNVVYFTLNNEDDKGVPRRSAYIETMRENGISDIDSRIFHGLSSSLQSVKNTLRQAAERHPGFTALSCETDYNALSMLRAGRELGIDIGGRITLTGFGNIPVIQELYPFATIEQHPQETGYRACSNLIARLERPKAQYPKFEKLEVELVNEERIKGPV